MKNEELKKLFGTQKTNIPDDGFSERVVRRLPERKSLLPQIIMITFIMIGLMITFAMPGFATSVVEQINSLVISISHSQIPSATSIVTYLGMLALLNTIGYSMARVSV